MSTKTLKIDVTQKNIDDGVKEDGLCPVEQAFWDAGLKGWLGSHEHGQFYCSHEYLEFCFGLPKEVTDFTVDFDNDREVKPFSFEVTL